MNLFLVIICNQFWYVPKLMHTFFAPEEGPCLSGSFPCLLVVYHPNVTLGSPWPLECTRQTLLVRVRVVWCVSACVCAVSTAGGSLYRTAATPLPVVPPVTTLTPTMRNSLYLPTSTLSCKLSSVSCLVPSSQTVFPTTSSPLLCCFSCVVVFVCAVCRFVTVFTVVLVQFIVFDSGIAWFMV